MTHDHHDHDHLRICEDCARGMTNIQRIGRAALLRHRDATLFDFRPADSPTLSAADLDLRSEFDAATIARIAREAVRPVR